MRQGDFTALSTAYANRPAYADHLIYWLVDMVGWPVKNARVADVGAGTGKLTAMLAAHDLSGYAIEPNEAMRGEGKKLRLDRFEWRAGSAEATGLDDDAVSWVTMASAFHWADAPRALTEFHRILQPGGYLTLLWNPRDLARDPLQTEIEAEIARIAPDIRRKSSGAARYTDGLEDLLLGSGLFENLVFLEAPHVEVMSRERHLGAWASVNDIRAQAGDENWAVIMKAIEARLAGMDQVAVHYRTRAWLVQRA